MPVNKSKAAFRTIAELAEELGVATHVLRFWETKFEQIKPMKRSGGRRYYRPDDVEIIKTIQHYLHEKRYTIEGVQKMFKEKGVKTFIGEEIQKDFFAEEPQTSEMDEKTRELLLNLQEQLKTLKNELNQALKAVK